MSNQLIKSVSSLKSEQQKIEYIQSLIKLKVSEPTVRKEVGRVWNIGKSARNSKYSKLFGAKHIGGKVYTQSAIKSAKKSNKVFQVTGDKAVAEVKNVADIITVEDLIAYANIDMDIWETTKTCANLWNGMWQIKAEFKRKVNEVDAKEFAELFKEELNKIPSKTFQASPKKKGNLYEIAIPDIHVGKHIWGLQVDGPNYDSKIAVDLFQQAIVDLASRVDMERVEKILLPLGNDLYNSDGITEMTAHSTQMDDDNRWQYTFTKGARMAIDAIEYLMKLAPVDVVICVGNHDTSKSFYLGEFLSAWFRNAPDVTVNNAPTLRKYYRWKNTLIGFTHSNEEKAIKELPLIMATERSQDWAECYYKVFQLGHTHRTKVEDVQGVELQTIASLCPSDFWHKSRGYIGAKRMAEGMLFDSEDGLIAKHFFHARS